MVESIRELKRRVQEPVRQYNDISGMLLGDHLSIHLTRLFIARGWSPTIATIGMLVCGLSGAVLTTFGEVAAVFGFGLLVLYYVCDCVDGEVARYHRIEKVFWSYHDYLFHLYVKSAFFLCLGVAAYTRTGHVWMFGIAWLGLSSVVLSKFLRELPTLLAARLVLMRDPDPSDRSYRQLTEVLDEREIESAPSEKENDAQPPSYGGALSKLRCILTNFDLMLVFFFLAAILDLFLEPFPLFGLTADAKVTLFLLMTVIVTVDFLDRMQHATRDDRFLKDASQVLLRAHHFRIVRGRGGSSRTPEGAVGANGDDPGRDGRGPGNHFRS